MVRLDMDNTSNRCQFSQESWLQEKVRSCSVCLLCLSLFSQSLSKVRSCCRSSSSWQVSSPSSSVLLERKHLSFSASLCYFLQESETDSLKLLPKTVQVVLPLGTDILLLHSLRGVILYATDLKCIKRLNTFEFWVIASISSHWFQWFWLRCNPAKLRNMTLIMYLRHFIGLLVIVLRLSSNAFSLFIPGSSFDQRKYQWIIKKVRETNFTAPVSLDG